MAPRALRHEARSGRARARLLAGGVVLGLAGCTSGPKSTDRTNLEEFAGRYAAAWSGGNPAELASFYAEDGWLTVNDGKPSAGREAIAATARAYMAAFPDMVVKLDSLREVGGHPVFHWTWTGTNTGPGGTGRAVRLSGYEEWTLGPSGLIAESRGHFDEAEYRRQLHSSAP